MAMGALGDIIDVIFSPNLLHDYAILYRSVYFQGRYGSGKTALAVWLAVRLAEKYRYRIISNIEIKHPAVITNPSPPRSGGIKGYFKWWVDSRVFGLYNSTHGGVGLTTERIISALIDSLSGTHAALGKGPLTPLVEVLDELDS
jgi:hypothetical protein